MHNDYFFGASFPADDRHQADQSLYQWISELTDLTPDQAQVVVRNMRGRGN